MSEVSDTFLISNIGWRFCRFEYTLNTIKSTKSIDLRSGCEARGVLLPAVEVLTSVVIPVSSRAATTYAVSEIFPWIPPWVENYQ